MTNQKPILCIDWGTSSFRAALVDPESQQIISSFQSQRGCKIIFQESQERQLDPLDHFTGELKTLLNANGIRQGDFSKIIISGMASSSIGMKELPYASLPFSLDGSGVWSETIAVDELGEIMLISGVSDREDIIRGEETQLLGLRDQLDAESSLLILPGTHSKHMTIRNGYLTGFKTYLTGELFELVSQQSVLSRSVMKSAWSSNHELAFCQGIDDAQNRNLLNGLFSIRARDILGKEKDPYQNYFCLSGLIIGSELIDLKSTGGKKIFACDENMKPLYETAVNQLGMNDAAFFGSDILAHAYLQGQLAILNHIS